MITIRPAASPVPALKYSLLPKPDEQVPGNAAIFYHRAIEQLLERRIQERPSPAAGAEGLTREGAERAGRARPTG